MANPTTLYEYYTGQGQALPSTAAARFADPAFASAAQRAGYTADNYQVNMNNAGANNAILAQLISGTPTPAPTPENTPPSNTDTNPIIGGGQTRADNDALGVDINGLKKSSEETSTFLKDRMDSLERQRAEEIAQIRAEYEQAAVTQGNRQAKDYAGRATGLITSGGGFLGATQSHEGVLQNLQATFEGEKNALMAKRDAAIREAQNAYSDKQFALAKEKIAEAKSYEQEVYNRQKDFADQKLKLSREKRDQTEFDMGIAEDKIKAYSVMDDATFAKQDVSSIDRFYFPGYAKAAREAEKKIAEGKSLESDLDLRNKLQTLINKTPAGQRFTLGGVTYVGMKKAAGGSGNTAGKISPGLAVILGIPSLGGKDESDVMIELSLENPPQWYKEFYQQSAPEIYQNLTPEQLKADWNIFTSQPDIAAYKNSATATKRIESDNANPLAGLTPEDIAAALSED